ncbi:mechanosensitive ion channel family protein [candidate division KSB1 bacterium]
MDIIKEYLSKEFLDNAIQDYLIAFGIFIASLVAFKVFERIILKKIKKWSKKTKTDLDDECVKILEGMPDLFYSVVSFYIALQFLSVHHMLSKFVNTLLIVLVFYWATKAVADLIEYLLHKHSQKKGKKEWERNTTYFALSLISKIILWSTGLLLVLSNLGVNISALVASLGIGGIAIALAMQNILSDMFSSFSIYFDKPFEIGDFIVVGDHMGIVKRIGLKTTRITALQGEEIVISNNELTSTRVRNFKKMKKRRIIFGFGVIYGTPTAKLKKIPGIIKKIVKKEKLADIDRVHFKEFAESSLNYEVVYFIKSADYVDYMDTQQSINLAIKEAFEKEMIEMAFPTRTIYMYQ